MGSRSWGGWIIITINSTSRSSHNMPWTVLSVSCILPQQRGLLFVETEPDRSRC